MILGTFSHVTAIVVTAYRVANVVVVRTVLDALQVIILSIVSGVLQLTIVTTVPLPRKWVPFTPSIRPCLALLPSEPQSVTPINSSSVFVLPMATQVGKVMDSVIYITPTVLTVVAKEQVSEPLSCCFAPKACRYGTIRVAISATTRATTSPPNLYLG